MSPGLIQLPESEIERYSTWGYARTHLEHSSDQYSLSLSPFEGMKPPAYAWLKHRGGAPILVISTSGHRMPNDCSVFDVQQRKPRRDCVKISGGVSGLEFRVVEGVTRLYASRQDDSKPNTSDI